MCSETLSKFRAVSTQLKSIFANHYNFIIAHLELCIFTKLVPVFVNKQKTIPHMELYKLNWKSVSKIVFDLGNLLVHFIIGLNWLLREADVFRSLGFGTTYENQQETTETWKIVMVTYFTLLYGVVSLGMIHMMRAYEDVLALVNFSIVVDYWENDKEREYNLNNIRGYICS